LTSKIPLRAAPWWKGASIYQIYPRSFCDSSGNGTGDLNGITSKLDYIAQLGVDAIWISPFYQSPMADFGYDISDYRAVDPLFGNLDDFRSLVETAHEQGLKVIIDQVLSHTSDAHEWFIESRESRTNSKSDWYVWADPMADGTAPNNWLSLFGGQAWTWDSRRQQYYLNNFLSSQPDLNFHNPEVRSAQLDNVKFWLDLGVDGFRFDVVNFYYHDKELQSNRPLSDSEVKNPAVADDNPYAKQRHEFDITQPQNLEFLHDLRNLMDRYSDTTSVGEICDDRPLDIMASYTSGNDKLHMAYTFDLLGKQFSADYIRGVIKQTEDTIQDGWPCWAMSNHDVERHNSRWGIDKGSDFAKMSIALLFSMRGSVCVYQGDELGLPQAEIAYEQLQDPYGFPFWPEYKGRDGCRTPMPWDDSDYAGFSQVEPWLPIPDCHRKHSIVAQTRDQVSVLNFTRAFIAWRNAQSALVVGDIELIEDTGDALCWLRKSEDQLLFVAINTTAYPLQVTLPFESAILAYEFGFTSYLDGGTLNLPPFQVAFYKPE